MGAKKEKHGEGGKKNGDGGGGGASAVVLKLDMHCEGCANKIIKNVQGFEGVESVKADGGADKLTVVGQIDPLALRDKVASKTKKKVELISQSPEKDKESNPNNKKPADDKKPKEAPPTSTTAVLKVDFHCQGCIEKIHKAITKTQGVEEIWMDKEKELVTVKGTMDVKALCECLKDRLKREVEVVPPKKDGGDGGGGKKKGGGEQEEDGVGTGKISGNRMAVPWYGLTSSEYEYGYGGAGERVIHAPQIFSDENPNACTVM